MSKPKSQRKSKPKKPVRREAPAKVVHEQMPYLCVSMRACSRMIGVPESILKDAKDKACPAFDASGRIYPFTWHRWYWDQQRSGEYDGKDFQPELVKWKAKREEKKLKREEGELVEWIDVDSVNSKANSLAFSELRRLALQEYPSKLKGLDEPAILALMTAMVETFEQTMKKQYELFAEEHAKNLDNE